MDYTHIQRSNSISSKRARFVRVSPLRTDTGVPLSVHDAFRAGMRPLGTRGHGWIAAAAPVILFDKPVSTVRDGKTPETI